ncbi:MAG: hypothetical protein LBU70_04070 [Chitinispirillales bacterium]|jgi:hypothetical protein|nr:hypothetical protein [Chitinispirillales bacterium]
MIESRCGMNEQTNRVQVPQSLAAEPPGKSTALASLIFGIVAMIFPIPVLDIIFGITGIVLSCNAKKQGYNDTLQIASLVCSIIGTVMAITYTIVILLFLSVARHIDVARFIELVGNLNRY